MSDQSQYLLTVLAKLQDNPTAQDIDFFVEAYSRIGYLAADAEGLAEEAEAERKHAEASAYLEVKREAVLKGEKVTEREAEAQALIRVQSYREAEVEARTKARKLRNLLESVEQAINAIKFIGRQVG
jgi:hypothetical protein